MEIDRSVSMSEAALKVFQQKCTPLREKIDAWNEIILTMPDCRRRVYDEIRYNTIDFREFLIEYIDQKKKLIEEFMDSFSSVYFFQMWGDFSQRKGPFTCFEDCREKALYKIRRNSDYQQFIIEKYSVPHGEMSSDEILDYGDEYIICILNRDGQITSIEKDACSAEECRLDMIFYNLACDKENGGG